MSCRADEKGSCQSTGVTYVLVCQACQSKYVEETSRSAYVRGGEHLKALQRREDGSVTWKHCSERHSGNIGKTKNVPIMLTVLFLEKAGKGMLVFQNYALTYANTIA